MEDTGKYEPKDEAQRVLQILRQTGWDELADSIGKLTNPAVYSRRLAGSMLVLSALKELGVDRPVLEYGENGKPRLENGNAPFFNVSHSGSYALCAVTDMPDETDIGADIQEITAKGKEIAERFFTDRENRWLSAFEEAAYDCEFTKIWALKESYIKMTGEGLFRELGSFSVIPGISGIRLYEKEERHDCRFTLLALPGYYAAVCVSLSGVDHSR